MLSSELPPAVIAVIPSQSQIRLIPLVLGKETMVTCQYSALGHEADEELYLEISPIIDLG